MVVQEVTRSVLVDYHVLFMWCHNAAVCLHFYNMCFPFSRQFSVVLFVSLFCHLEMGHLDPLSLAAITLMIGIIAHFCCYFSTISNSYISTVRDGKISLCQTAYILSIQKYIKRTGDKCLCE